MTEAMPRNVTVFRFDPDVDEAPYYETYPVPRRPYMRILDVLEYIYQEHDVPLAYRWFCGTKKCGECAITVNGAPSLSCWEPATDEMTLEPLSNFPIVRDLTVDNESYERHIVSLKPHLERRRVPAFPEKLKHSEMDSVHRLSKCIECNVCTAAAPVKAVTKDGIDWSEYSGAAAWVRFARFVLDPRDETDRRQIAQQAGLENFPLFFELDGICPQEIEIVRDALVPMNRRLFGIDSNMEPTVPAFNCFLRGVQWSGFIRLTEQQTAQMIDQQLIYSMNIDGIERAYRFKT